MRKAGLCCNFVAHRPPSPLVILFAWWWERIDLNRCLLLWFRNMSRSTVAEKDDRLWRRVALLAAIGLVVLVCNHQFIRSSGSEMIHLHQHESALAQQHTSGSSSLDGTIGDDTSPGTVRAATSTSATVLEQSANNVGNNIPPSVTLGPDKDRGILFVHVGKAGVSLRSPELSTKLSLLRLFMGPCTHFSSLTYTAQGLSVEAALYNKCRDSPRIVKSGLTQACLDDTPDSKLAQLTWHSLHVGGPADYNNRKGYILGPNCTSFLYVIRHPVHRAVSSYWYRHPLKFCREEERRDGSCRKISKISEKKRRFFVQCFPAVEDLAQALSLNYDQSSPCHDLALRVMTGDFVEKDQSTNPSDVTWDDLERVDHLANYNYRYFAADTIFNHPKREVLTARLAHLWEDLSDLDIWLGGTGDFGYANGRHNSHGSERVIDKRPLTPEGSKLMCCGLLEEMHIYRELLFRGANVPNAVKEETWKHDLKVCDSESLQMLAQECESLVDMKQLRAQIVNRWGDTFLDPGVAMP